MDAAIAKKISSTSLSVAEDELDSQINRLSDISSSLVGVIYKVLRPGGNDEPNVPVGEHIMDSAMASNIMGYADRIRLITNRLEDAYSRVDL